MLANSIAKGLPPLADDLVSLNIGIHGGTHLATARPSFPPYAHRSTRLQLSPVRARSQACRQDGLTTSDVGDNESTCDDASCLNTAPAEKVRKNFAAEPRRHPVLLKIRTGGSGDSTFGQLYILGALVRVEEPCEVV